MSKASERRKAKEEAKEARKHGNEERYHCPFPGCPRTFWKEEGQPSVCTFHRQMISDVVFILNQLRASEELVAKQAAEEKKGPVILVPKPGMSNKAIEEAARAAKLQSKGGKKQ